MAAVQALCVRCSNATDLRVLQLKPVSLQAAQLQMEECLHVRRAQVQLSGRSQHSSAGQGQDWGCRAVTPQPCLFL